MNESGNAIITAISSKGQEPNRSANHLFRTEAAISAVVWIKENPDEHP
jgi:hypothetical protein